MSSLLRLVHNHMNITTTLILYGVWGVFLVFFLCAHFLWITRDNKAAGANVDNELSTLLPRFLFCLVFYLHVTATFVRGCSTRLEDTLSDNSCLGIS